MNKLIIDAAKDKIFLMIINNDINYSITHENSKINYEKLSILINDFLNKKNLDLDKVSQIYVNRGPGSFAGIRNSLSVVKAFHLANKIGYNFVELFTERKINKKNPIWSEKGRYLLKKISKKNNLSLITACDDHIISSGFNKKYLTYVRQLLDKLSQLKIKIVSSILGRHEKDGIYNISSNSLRQLIS